MQQLHMIFDFFSTTSINKHDYQKAEELKNLNTHVETKRKEKKNEMKCCNAIICEEKRKNLHGGDLFKAIVAAELKTDVQVGFTELADKPHHGVTDIGGYPLHPPCG